ncbi:MAG: hypothetical protein H0W99_12435, partial [Acidobacteria bacterium]|nr:hypothetical protein [Acidobacteriota bacterium]
MKPCACRWLSSLLVLAIAYPLQALYPSSSLQPDYAFFNTGKGEGWDPPNNPAGVDSEFNYNAASLPISGEAQNMPWPSYDWPTVRDSINYRWDGNNLSPAEKVAEAFNLPNFPQNITETAGIYGHQGFCDEDPECQIHDVSLVC